MRHHKLRMALVCVALVLVGAALYVRSALRGGEVDEVARLLPADVPAMIAVRGFGDLAIEFREGWRGEMTPEITRLCEAARKAGLRELEFDPFDVWAWRAHGLDFTRPWGVALLGRDSRGLPDSVVGIVPVCAEKPIVDLLRHLLDRRGLEHHELKKGGVTFEVVDADPGGEKARTAFTVANGWLLAAGSDDSIATLQQVLSADPVKRLDGHEEFRRLKRELGERWHLLAYASEALTKKARDAAGLDREPAIAVLGTGGAGLAMDLANHVIEARAVVVSATDSQVLQVLSRGRDDFASRVSGRALGGARLNLDVSRLWARVSESATLGNEARKAVREFNEKHSADFERDVLGALDGSLGVVAIEKETRPTSKRDSPVDVVAWIGLKDAKRVGSLLESIEKKTGRDLDVRTERVGDNVWYSENGGAVGLVGDHLVGVYGERSRVAGSGASFTRDLDPSIRIAWEGGPSFVAYVDAAHTLPIVAEQITDIPFIGGLMNEKGAAIDRVMLSVSAADGVLSGKLDLLSPQQGFAAAWKAAAAGMAKGGAFDNLIKELSSPDDAPAAAPAPTPAARGGAAGSMAGDWKDNKSGEQLRITEPQPGIFQVRYRVREGLFWQDLSNVGPGDSEHLVVSFGKRPQQYELSLDSSRDELGCKNPDGSLQTYVRRP